MLSFQHVALGTLQMLTSDIQLVFRTEQLHADPYTCPFRSNSDSRNESEAEGEERAELPLILQHSESWPKNNCAQHIAMCKTSAGAIPLPYTSPHSAQQLKCPHLCEAFLECL